MSRASIESSTPSSRDSTWNGKPAPSRYLHKQLDVTGPRLRRHDCCPTVDAAAVGSAWRILTLWNSPQNKLRPKPAEPDRLGGSGGFRVKNFCRIRRKALSSAAFAKVDFAK